MVFDGLVIYFRKIISAAAGAFLRPREVWEESETNFYFVKKVVVIRRGE